MAPGDRDGLDQVRVYVEDMREVVQRGSVSLDEAFGTCADGFVKGVAKR
jgi:hypothetical protein